VLRARQVESATDLDGGGLRPRRGGRPHRTFR